MDDLDSPSLVLVPLIFDGTDSLYSAEGYNQALAAADDGAEPVEGDLYFTDLDTFVRVIGGSGRRAGRSYEHLYADGGFQAVPSGVVNSRVALGGGGHPTIVDPYQCGDAIPCPVTNAPPPDCDLFPDDPNCDGGGGDGGGGGAGGGTIPSRPPIDQSAIRSSSPDWPDLWVGDVISGEKDCGSSGYSSNCTPSSGGGSFTFSNLGHSLIITALDSGEQWGGDFTDTSTLSMEAVGKKENEDDQVIEREAYTWFDDPRLEHAKVLYHRHASWSERHAAVAYALAQDPDPYDATTTKNNEDKWYCSKLVWKAYKEATGDSLDPNWGPFVFPSDLEHSGHLVTVYHYEHE